MTRGAVAYAGLENWIARGLGADVVDPGEVTRPLPFKMPLPLPLDVVSAKLCLRTGMMASLCARAKGGGTGNAWRSCFVISDSSDERRSSAVPDTARERLPGRDVPRDDTLRVRLGGRLGARLGARLVVRESGPLRLGARDVLRLACGGRSTSIRSHAC